MQINSTVRFDRAERDVLKRVETHLGLLHDGDGEKERDDERARALRALLIRNQEGTHALLSKALAGVEALAERCRIERSVDYWTHALSATGEPITPDTTGGSLVVAPYKACQYLAEARAGQYEDAVAAFDLLTAALGLASRPRDDREDI